MAKDESKLRAMVETGIHPTWRRCDADLINPLVATLETCLSGSEPSARDVTKGVINEVKQVTNAIAELCQGHEVFNQRHAVMRTERELRENILAYAKELGANERQLRGDRKAFRRFFGHDAMVARFARCYGDLQRELAFLLERLGTVAQQAFCRAPSPQALWDELALEPLITPLLEFDGDPRVATSAFKGLALALLGLPKDKREAALSLKTLQAIHRMGLDRERDVWLQCEAVALLKETSTESFTKVVSKRLGEPTEGDDLFVRRRLITLLADTTELRQEWFPEAAEDPMPFVRQEVANLLAEELTLLEQLAVRDGEPAVRGAALLAMLRFTKAIPVAEILVHVLRNEKNVYVLRVALKVAVDMHAALTEGQRTAWRDILMPALRKVHQETDCLPARRWAAQARERLWCATVPRRTELAEKMRRNALEIPPGKSGFLNDSSAATMDDETLGRILSVAVQEDFGLDVTRKRSGLRFVRGHRFGFRFWRFWHEIRNPSPDKRQAFRHTIGRIFEGSLRVPSALLSEMSLTKVPGEPFTIASEGGWRPYLPLVDDLVSTLEENSYKNPLKIVTSEGVTIVRPPRSSFTRWRAHLQLIKRFPEFARLRNSEKPDTYVAAIREIGFECDYAPFQKETTDPAVARCYGLAFAPFLAMLGPDPWMRIRSYFYSVYENSLSQLFIFLAVATAFFGGRHIYFNQVFFRLRNKIPLVVGGWGTRGKSGTERIKAALFNGLGHRMVSKTTGCEAMFLYSETFGKTHELFLFRPYDKATIWEQVNIVNLSARLGSHVFLWECMGLTPAYIEIIQRQWMKDDIATIVNTYPDHEDLQGPAGVNIPEVMTYFVRKDGHIVTSEQQMTPILEAEAHRLDSKFDHVGWLEPGLLTPDILERFPYAEHPNNIALVAELGAQLGVPYDFSIKEMADRVVPDLGVLKVYPIAHVNGRQLQFVNGCSANERFGALGNWTRLEFDTQDPTKEPGVWISAVVNNRADRIARSRVFASIVIEDVSVDRLFLIGSNLDGMVGYIRDAYDAYKITLTLFQQEGKASPEDVFRQTTLRWRLPTSEAELQQYLDAMQGEAGLAADLDAHQQPYQIAFEEYQAFAKKLANTSNKDTLDSEFRDLLWTWYERKLVVIHDYYSTGDQTMHRIIGETPPGYLNKIMGLQNIKGTGLDFVYRWQAWDACYNACQQLKDRKAKVAREGAAALAAFKDYGLLCEAEVLAATKVGSEKHGSKDKGLQTQLDLIVASMEDRLTEIKGGLGAGDDSARSNRFTTWLLRFMESLLDAGDAVRRRKKADQVYKDMANGRISPARAAQEIQLLNKRQKGGWLKRDLQAWKTKRLASH